MLEGKFVSDERVAASANASAIDLVNETDQEKVNTVDTLEKAVIEAEEKSIAPAEETEGEAVSDVETTKKTESAGKEGSDPEDAALKEDTFADATSSPTSVEEVVSSHDVDNADVPDDKTQALDGATARTSSDETREPALEVRTEDADAKVAQDSLNVPPPVPARSAARSSGRTSPAPALPPRRPPRATSLADKSLPVPSTNVSFKFGPPSVTSLHLSKLDAMEWEDKMWTEITKLKQDLWNARIGLLTDTATD